MSDRGNGAQVAKPSVPDYELVTNRARLRQVLKASAKSQHGTALDVETTALHPNHGRVRLVQLYNDRGVACVIDCDKMKGGFKAIAKEFENGGQFIAFYSGFENRWFLDAGAEPVCDDVWHLRCAVLGGGRSSLAAFVKSELDIDLDKTQQTSNWAAPQLTQEQLDYAFEDAWATWRVWAKYKMSAKPGQLHAFHMFGDMVPAVIEMEDAGILLDAKAHAKTVEGWAEERDALLTTIRRWVDEHAVANINSDAQWSDYFSKHLPDTWVQAWPRTSKSGQLSMKSAQLRSIASHAPPDSPLRTVLMSLADYKAVSKYLSSFGDNLITTSKLSSDGRVRARFNIAAARTGRFSSSGPNLQNIPRTHHVRDAFIAPMGRVLVSLDYSGIELRTLALLTDDEQLLADCLEGSVHDNVAAKLAGRPIDKTVEADKEIRVKAKGVSFGIIYGSGAAGIASSLGCSIGDAQDYIDFWAHRYPKAFELRHTTRDEARRTRFITCVDGGTIFMGKKPELPKCANYPVQRAALSIMAKAIARHKASLDKMRRGGRYRMTKMLATIHDALIDECSSGHAKTVLRVMERDMIAGYLDVFPNAPTEKLVEGGIGKSWGTLE